jgi:AAA ATPase domain
VILTLPADFPPPRTLDRSPPERRKPAIHTGEVVIDAGTRPEPLVVGNAVEVAERLVGGAKPGDVVIGAETYRLVAGMVEAEPLEEVASRVSAWRILGFSAQKPGLGFPFVGREHELRLLRDVFARAIYERSCQSCTLVGPAGIGKSRLAHEFVEQLTDTATIAVGRCLSYGEGITYWPLREIISELAEAEPRDWIKTRLTGDASATAVAERVAAAVGAGEGGAQPEETSWAFRKLFEALAGERPLLLVIGPEPNQRRVHLVWIGKVAPHVWRFRVKENGRKIYGCWQVNTNQFWHGQERSFHGFGPVDGRACPPWAGV